MNSSLRILSLALCFISFSAAAQPTFESPSPTQASSTSQQANQMADKGL